MVVMIFMGQSSQNRGIIVKNIHLIENQGKIGCIKVKNLELIRKRANKVCLMI